jgi:hypothetical protein
MKTLNYWVKCCICLLWEFCIDKTFWTIIDFFPYRIFKDHRDRVIDCFLEIEDKFIEFMGYLPQQTSHDNDLGDIEF